MSKEIVRGASWMVALRMCDRVIGLASTLILARLLVPADFGLVAMAMSFIALVELMSAFGFELALIQHKAPTRDHYDTAWTLNLSFALLCGTLTAVTAPLVAKFFSEPRLTTILLLLAGGWALQGLENIGIVDFRRNLTFSREFVFVFSKRVLGVIVTLTLAFAFRSYWALIAGQLTGRLAGVLLSYVMSPYRPRLSLSARTDMFKFSFWIFITSALSFGIARLPHFILGRSDGPAAVGTYTIASEFARLPSTELAAPINRAVLPGLARLQHDRSALIRTFEDTVALTYALTLPACIGLAFIAFPLVHVLLGSRWIDAGSIMAILAIAGSIEVIAANTGIAYLALGHTRLIALLSGLKLIMLIAFSFALVPKYGVLGMAASEAAASLGSTIMSVLVAVRVLHVKVGAAVARLWRPVAASAVLLYSLHVTFGFAGSGEASLWSFLTLLQAIVLGASSYVVALLGLWLFVGRPIGTETLIIASAARVVTLASRMVTYRGK